MEHGCQINIFVSESNVSIVENNILIQNNYNSQTINQINFLTTFKRNDKYIKLHFYQLKIIQLQSPIP